MLRMNDLRIGMLVALDGQPYEVTWSDFMRTAQRKPVMRTKLRNLINGNVLERTFKPDDKIEEADLTMKKVTYLYSDQQGVHFMDSESYDQFFFPPRTLAEKVKFLKDGLELDVMRFDGKPVTVKLPTKVKYKVVEAAPGVRGDTASNVFKTIKLENGMDLKTPLFINEGDEVIVNTETGEYVERA